jgi:hypothetical protein
MLPRNLRCKAPRPLSSRPRGASSFVPPSSPRVPSARAPRSSRSRVVDSTPTPPPVVIAADPPPPSSARPSQRQSRTSRLGAALFLCMLALTVGGSAAGWRTLTKRGLLPWSSLTLAAAHAAPSAEASAPAAEPPPGAPAWTVTHEGYVPISGGVLLLPKSFVAKADGSYDLVIHFHGNRHIVEESLAYAGIDAALAIVNLGVRSTPYRDAFRVPNAFESLLAEIQAAMKQKGVPSPRLARLALTSWSAGYGAIESILEHRKSPDTDADPLDALIILDGIHTVFVDNDPRRLVVRDIEAFTRVAQAAAHGDIFVSMTHSQIDPIEYCSAKRAQVYILDQLETPATMATALRTPQHLQLASAKKVVYEGREKRMVPTMEARIGELRVQGFQGVTAEHHTAHLTQMASVVLPDLKARWAKPRVKSQHPAEVEEDDELIGTPAPKKPL